MKIRLQMTTGRSLRGDLFSEGVMSFIFERALLLLTDVMGT
jgi:hypothetical protein